MKREIALAGSGKVGPSQCKKRSLVRAAAKCVARGGRVCERACGKGGDKHTIVGAGIAREAARKAQLVVVQNGAKDPHRGRFSMILEIHTPGKKCQCML